MQQLVKMNYQFVRLPAVEEPFNELQTVMVLWTDTGEFYQSVPNQDNKTISD